MDKDTVEGYAMVKTFVGIMTKMKQAPSDPTWSVAIKIGDMAGPDIPGDVIEAAQRGAKIIMRLVKSKLGVSRIEFKTIRVSRAVIFVSTTVYR